MKKNTIKIAHLYYDLMNLYGEVGNVRALKTFIERNNVNVEVHFLTINDKIDFDKYDVYYIGAGSYQSLRLVLDDLKKYRKDIEKAVKKKMFLITGNAMELFGKKIRLQDSTSIECLDIFDYQAYQLPKRMVSELYLETNNKEYGEKFIGFQNAECMIVHNDKENRIIDYLPNNFKKDNFYAFEIIGPILIRNPYFTNYLVKILFLEKGYDYTEITNTLEFTAYKETLERIKE